MKRKEATQKALEAKQRTGLTFDAIGPPHEDFFAEKSSLLLLRWRFENGSTTAVLDPFMYSDFSFAARKHLWTHRGVSVKTGW